MDEESVQKIRYLFDEFPSVISSNPIDDNLLSFWEGANRSDEMLKFIFYYRIIEYAGMSYAGEKLKMKFRRIIKKPSIHHNYERALEEILNVHNSASADNEIPRIKNLLTEVVDLRLVWKEIEKNQKFFSETHVFDGGFELKPLLGASCKYNNFESNGQGNRMNKLAGDK